MTWRWQFNFWHHLLVGFIWGLLIVAAIVALSLLIQLLSTPARAQAFDDPADRAVYAIAVRSLQAGSVDQGYKLLLVLAHRDPTNRDLQIVIARTEIARDDSDLAVRRLKLLAAQHPDWPRPRMELARAHALNEDWGEAKAVLIAELGKDPPRDARRKLERMVRALEDKQTFLVRYSVGVAPDSNVNAGSSASTVNFAGVPLTLSDDAKQQDGFRGEFGLGFTVRSQWHENTRAELSVDGHHSEPLQDTGDPNSNVRFTGAVRLRGSKGGGRVGAEIRPYYYNNAHLRTERHLFIEPYRRMSDRITLFGRLAIGDGEVNDSAARDFTQWEGQIGPSIAVGETGRIAVSGLFRERWAEDDVFSYIRRGINVRATAAPWNGWRVTLSGEITRDVYDDPQFIFGARQEDLTRAARLTFTKTGTVWWGFSPTFGVGWSRTESTIDLFDRDSTSFIVGVGLPY